MKPFARSGDFWSGVALAALGAYIVSQARAWTYLGEEGPGPGFFPLWYGSLMVALSLVLVAGSLLGRRAPRAEPVRWDEVGRAMSTWAAFVACVALMPWIGFMPAFALLAWFVVAVMARRPQRIAIPLAVGFALLFYGIFDWGLDLSLPRSPWF